jgi:hypothetical protein
MRSVKGTGAPATAGTARMGHPSDRLSPSGITPTMMSRRRMLDRACLFAVVAAAVLIGCGGRPNGSPVPNRRCRGGPRGDNPPSASYQTLQRDELISADYWEAEPRILGAGLGFTDIIGVPGLSSSNPAVQQQAVLAAGGAWEIVDTTVSPVPLRAYTSAASPMSIAFSYGWPVEFCDGLPIEFSWPVLPSTVDAADFRVILNDGEAVTPRVASVFPNFEYNERSTVVIFGAFGNRRDPSEPGARYPVLFEIVDRPSPLMLVGPGGRVVSAAGLSYGDGTTPRTAYADGAGPTLVAAKLSRMSTAGEGGPDLFNGQMPNDGVALYGDAARYRLRVLTTGGFSPDGVRSVLPTEFARFFRLVATDAGGHEQSIDETGRSYAINGGHLTVLGLADLGIAQSSYDDGYVEDHDNQIDIVLDGDDAAVRAITAVEIPASAPYDPFYNPGGPGNDPKPGTRYTQPGPSTSQPVTIALDDPMTVDWPMP